MELDALHVTQESQRDWHRNIVSLRTSIDIFRDLVDNAKDEKILIAHEINTKPYKSDPPLINRVFEEAEIIDPIAQAIHWPFEHPSESRYSAGGYGVWYGADSLLTSIHETVYHFRRNTLASTAVDLEKPVIQERRVHLVQCTAALLDLRPQLRREPRYLDANDYSACQALGLQIYHASLPGILSRSVRHPEGVIVGVFRREALINPRTLHFLTYRLDAKSGRVRVERERGQVMLEIDG